MVKASRTKILIIVVIIVIITILIFFNKKSGSISNGYTRFGRNNLDQLRFPKKGEEIAIIKTNMGEIKMRLFPEVAPKAVENFITLSMEGFYDGHRFDRIEEDFLIQTLGTEEYPEGKSIFGEFFEKETSLEYRHYSGAVGLAQNPRRESASSFYIICNSGIDPSYLDMVSMIGADGGYPPNVIRAYKNFGGVPRLDLKFTVFGQVFYGMDTVMKINQIPMEVDPDTLDIAPAKSVFIETIEIVPYEGK